MLYDIAFFIFSLFYLPALIFKGKLHRDFGERFGSYSADKRRRLAAAKDAIWIQAVSVGEVSLCRPFIPLLKARFPGSDIVFSTITKTGNDLAKKLYSQDAIIIYFPLDFTIIVKKVIGLIRPKIYIMVETEIWPNVLAELAIRSVPAALINGRISDRSFGRYMAVKRFMRGTLGRIEKFCMQSDLDVERITAMGSPAERVTVAGNMKLDILPLSVARPARSILNELGLKDEDKLLVAGSTHAGEEAAVIEAYKGLLGHFPDLHLIIAPRHIQRAGAVEKVARSFGFEPIRVSRIPAVNDPPAAIRVLVLDTIGKLGEIYSVATLVFIGGSLVTHGGQNPIEPATFEKPVIFGPHMFNFKSIVSLLLERGGAVQIKDKGELLEAAGRLLQDQQYRMRVGKNAKAVIMENRGASQRCADIISKLMDR